MEKIEDYPQIQKIIQQDPKCKIAFERSRDFYLCENEESFLQSNFFFFFFENSFKFLF